VRRPPLMRHGGGIAHGQVAADCDNKLAPASVSTWEIVHKGVSQGAAEKVSRQQPGRSMITGP